MLLKQKVYASLISAIVLPLAISTFLFSNNIKSHAEEKLAKIDLPTALGEVRNAVELELLQPITMSKAIAQNTLVTNWLANGENEQQLADFTQYLSNIKNKENAITSFIVSKNSRNYYTADGISRKISQAEDGWFYSFINSSKEFELSLDIDKKLGKAAVFINYAIEVNGQRTAIGGVGRSLEAMTKLIQSHHVGTSGIVYLVGANGEIKLHPNKNLIGNQVNLTAVQGGKIEEISQDERSFIRSSTPLTSLDWHLVAEIPEQELYGAIDDAINMNILFGVIIAAIGFVLVRILSNQIFKPIEVITKAVNALTQNDGDLTARLPIKDENEISKLADNFNVFLEQLHGMFCQVSESSQSVKNISDSVKTEMSQAMKLSENQSESTHTVAAAVNEMEMTVLEISESANRASEIANDSQDETVKGNAYVVETIEQMTLLEQSMASSVQSVSELSDEIQSITHVLEVIKGISEQTNLLALNAAIEAARAGEQGRGFAVVADEVRTLAQKTAESTEEINSMINTLKSKASDTVSAIEVGSNSTKQTSDRLSQTGETLSDVSTKIESLTEVNTQVATATKEQTSATSEISHNIVLISDTASETKDKVLQSTELCNQLNEEANSLDNLINKFTL